MCTIPELRGERLDWEHLWESSWYHHKEDAQRCAQTLADKYMTPEYNVVGYENGEY